MATATIEATATAWCSGHQRYEPVGEFNPHPTRKTGLQSYCYAWGVAYQKRHMAKLSSRSRAELDAAIPKSKWCPGYGDIPGHIVEDARSGFSRSKYRADNCLGRCKECTRAQKAVREAAQCCFTKDRRHELMSTYGYVCFYCEGKATTLDHLQPVERGGKTCVANIVPACQSCNSSKKDRDIAVWLQHRPDLDSVWIEVQQYVLPECERGATN